MAQDAWSLSGALTSGARRHLAATSDSDRVLAALRQGSRVTLAIRGETGQGKTTLLAGIAARAEEAGMVVLALEGRATEREIPYTGIRSLLMQYVPAAPPDASPVHRMIRALVADFEPPRSPLAVCGAVSVWIGCLAPSAPCLICVDDVDHVDEESMRVLAYVAARLPAGRVALVCASTTAVPLLERIGASQLLLDDLDEAAAHGLLRASGVGLQMSGSIVARLGGNPLALTFAAESVSAAAGTGFAELEPAPLHRRREEDVRARLGFLPRPTAYLLEAAAVSRSQDLHALSSWSEQRQLGVAEMLLAPAEDVGLVTTHLDHLRWRRPWMAEAVVQLCPPGRRERLRSQVLVVAPERNGVGDRLTRAEARVAEAVVRGASNRQAAVQLSLSEKTVDSHLQHIYRKLDVRSRSQLVAALLTSGEPRSALHREAPSFG